MKTIRQLREERRWTQLELAIKLGVTPVTVYNWERGKVEPRVVQFRALAQVFGVSMDEIELTTYEPGKPTVDRRRQLHGARSLGSSEQLG